jgi:hypothetical protein
VIADPVDDWSTRAPRVVQVRDAVGKTRTEMQQSRGGPSRHACPPVGRAGTDALEQPEDDSQSRCTVEGHDNRHFGGARICEADLYTSVQCGVDQAECTCVHSIPSSGLLWSGPPMHSLDMQHVSRNSSIPNTLCRLTEVAELRAIDGCPIRMLQK